MSAFHPGERAVQERVGVRGMAEKIGRSIHDAIWPAGAEFLRAQPMAFLGTVDAGGAVWASVLVGRPGFMRTIGEQTLRIEATPSAGDPLRENLHAGAPVGVLAIEFSTRRRMRLNGVVEMDEGAILVHAREVYGNCPKYIQRRELEAGIAPPVGGRLLSQGAALTSRQRAWIAGADTFIVASAHPEVGADASHRGGNPGFVQVVDPRTLRWPDYTGNTMFQTLGNIAVSPAAGLLFVDFERGGTLQMTGKARIVWEGEALAGLGGAERAVEFTVERTIEIEGSIPRGWTGPEPSPHNPPTHEHHR